MREVEKLFWLNMPSGVILWGAWVKKFWCYAFIFSVQFLGFSLAAESAEERCPPWASERLSIVNHMSTEYELHGDGRASEGPRLTLDSYYETYGAEFKMPLGFRNPWPTGQRLLMALKSPIPADQGEETRGENGSVVTRFSRKGPKGKSHDATFSFWMPSLRYVERNLANLAFLRPCEAGRPRPTEDTYVVQMIIKWPFLEGSERSWGARRFHLAKNRLKKDRLLPSQKYPWAEHSLNGYVSGDKDYFVYSDDGDLAVDFYCMQRLGGAPAPNPLCSGWVWQRSSNLILFLRFPADRGQRATNELWREPVSAAIRLAKKWYTLGGLKR